MASAQHERARRFLLEQGLSPKAGLIAALRDELNAAERRARDEILDLIACHVGPRAANAIAAQLAQPASITPRDGLAQPGEHVPDQHGRAAAPAEVR